LRTTIEEYILDIAQIAAREIGVNYDLLTFRSLVSSERQQTVADASLVFAIDGMNRRDDVIIVVSNPQFPNTAFEAAVRAKAFRSVLSPKTAEKVLLPLFEGTFETQSYAIYRRLRPLSDVKGFAYFQKRLIANPVVKWLSEVAKETESRPIGRDVVERSFMVPLDYLTNERDLSERPRATALKYLTMVKAQDAELISVAEHGDLWIGNILLEQRLLNKTFFVIDWRGSRLDGYPFVDLLRLCMSIGVRNLKARSLFERYAADAALSGIDPALHCLAALGRIGLNLDQFPKAGYLDLVERACSALVQVHKTG
jgi:hypothetical protein